MTTTSFPASSLAPSPTTNSTGREGCMLLLVPIRQANHFISQCPFTFAVKTLFSVIQSSYSGSKFWSQSVPQRNSRALDYTLSRYHSGLFDHQLTFFFLLLWWSFLIKASQGREEGLIFICLRYSQSIIELKWQECETVGHITFTIGEQNHEYILVLQCSFSILYMTGCLTYGKILFRVIMCFHISIYIIKIISHKHAEPVSQVTLVSFKLTINKDHRSH